MSKAVTLVSLVSRPRRHYYQAWCGIAVERSGHGRWYAFIMWRGRTVWLRRA